MEVFRTAVALMVRSMVLSAQSAGQQRLLWLQQSAAVGGEVGEVARLRDENRRLKSENRLLKARDADAPCRKRYSLRVSGARGTALRARRCADEFVDTTGFAAEIPHFLRRADVLALTHSIQRSCGGRQWALERRFLNAASRVRGGMGGNRILDIVA